MWGWLNYPLCPYHESRLLIHMPLAGAAIGGEHLTKAKLSAARGEHAASEATVATGLFRAPWSGVRYFLPPARPLLAAPSRTDPSPPGSQPGGDPHAQSPGAPVGAARRLQATHASRSHRDPPR